MVEFNSCHLICQQISYQTYFSVLSQPREWFFCLGPLPCPGPLSSTPRFWLSDRLSSHGSMSSGCATAKQNRYLKSEKHSSVMVNNILFESPVIPESIKYVTVGISCIYLSPYYTALSWRSCPLDAPQRENVSRAVELQATCKQTLKCKSSSLLALLFSLPSPLF